MGGEGRRRGGGGGAGKIVTKKGVAAGGGGPKRPGNPPLTAEKKRGILPAAQLSWPPSRGTRAGGPGGVGRGRAQRTHLGWEPRHYLEIKDGGRFISVFGKNDTEVHCSFCPTVGSCSCTLTRAHIHTFTHKLIHQPAVPWVNLEQRTSSLRIPYTAAGCMQKAVAAEASTHSSGPMLRHTRFPSWQ